MGLPILDIRPAVARAIEQGQPVVALESAVLTHGLPRPVNLETARELEGILAAGGAKPATVAVLDGRPVVGLEADELERICSDKAARKLNRRDLAPATALGWSGGTTVSATMVLARAAGIRVFATGGIGGVHPGAAGDVSADLDELARTPVAVVCSGAKSILDLDRTLEALETRGVPVVGWRTDIFPEFFTVGSGRPTSARVDTAPEAAHVIEAQLSLGSGLLLCVPCPAEAVVPESVVARALAEAEAAAARQGVTGKDLTPFLLGRLAETTQGATLRANLALLRNNAAVAATIAGALAARG
jgi:pseudouridine-5'-phosphate glycosidase